MHAFSVAAPKLLTALLAYEVSQNYCREMATLLAGDGADVTYELGTLLGFSTDTAAAAAADAGNVGNGVLTLANPAVAAGVVPGAYRVIMLEAVADGGRFEVFGPDGVAIGHGAVGVAFDGVVKFTIADGATDFKANDGWTITVATGTKLVDWDPAAVDGSAVVDSVLLARTTAPDGEDAPALVLRRGPAIIKADGIVWPAGVTDDQKAAAIAALKLKGILVQ